MIILWVITSYCILIKSLYLPSQSATSPQASARICQWSSFLSAYEYNLKFRDNLSHANADALSRVSSETDTHPEVILLMEHFCNSPVIAHDIQAAIRNDSLLSKVLQYVHRGWPDNNMGGAELSLFSYREMNSLCRYILGIMCDSSFSTSQGCL